MTVQPRFSVIIVNYNGGDWLKGALASLAVQTRKDFEVFLVDNASTDGSANRLGSCLPETLHILLQDNNTGFAAGNNIAARQARGEWLVLLNPDARATFNWLDRLDAAISRHPGIRSFASAQINLTRPDILDGAGDAWLGFGLAWRGGYGHPVSTLPPEGECFSACGAGAMIHRETFLRHGGFDERFFCFCEDVDLGYRLRLAGEKCLFVPDAVIHHAGGGLSGRTSAFALFHGTRNRLWTYVKNTPSCLLALTWPIHVLLTFAILVRGLFTGRFGDTWRGLCAGLAGIKPFWRARKTLAQTRTAGCLEIAGVMCWNPLKLLQRKTHVIPVKPALTPMPDGRRSCR